MPTFAAPPADAPLAGPNPDEAGSAEKAACCAAGAEGEEIAHGEANAADAAPVKMTIPDIELIDQNGRKVRFYSDLVKGKVVAMNFIFTTCTTICPPLTANFAQVQQLAKESGGRDFSLISISVDPVNDTPECLKAWGATFGAGPGWTFLTGNKHDVDTVLKALGVFTPLKEEHSPLVVVGNEPAGDWTRVYGLAAPEKLYGTIDEMIGDATAAPEEAASAAENPSAHEYFTDVELVNQNGETMRFYSDLIRGKVVVIDCFFTECVGVCPALARNLLAIQDALGDRLGRDVHLISISVDPLTDTPPRMLEYAERHHAKDGWYFVSGKKENVDFALSRLGLQVEAREQHSNLFFIGNDRTGLWKKAFGLSTPEEIVPIVESVVNDSGT